MIKIKNLKLKNRIFLAPMHQINDIPFRLLCKKAGASLTYTGLTNPQTKEKLFLDDKPALQFACNSTKGLREFIKKQDKNISLYDFNLGCPSPHAKSSKIGYFMIENTKIIKEILKTIKQNTKKPITIKIRIMNDKTLLNIIKLAEKYCDAISIHPRTQPQGYSGEPDLSFARKIKHLTKLPVIYSGNINSKEQAEKMLAEFDFIMIGRASIGNPNIFSELTNAKNKKIKFSDWLKLAKNKKYNISDSQIKFQALNFIRDFVGAAKTRNIIANTKDTQEIINLMKELNL